MDVLYEPNQHSPSHDVGAPIGHIRQRKASHRHDAKGHSDVLEYLPEDHCESTDADESAQLATGHLGRAPDAPQDHAKEGENQAASDQTELFSDG